MSERPGTVELIPIESQTRTIQSCFQTCLYEVPDFQRPYSWTSDQLQDFWDDLVLARGDFFFGSTVTWVSEKRELFNDTHSIIDGQQRLTTSAILLSVIRDAFSQIADNNSSSASVTNTARNQADVTQKYLIASDDDGRTYPILTRPEKAFYKCIQNPTALPSRANWSQSTERIGEARAFFEERVLSELGHDKAEENIERLKQIRGNVLKARVIQVELLSEEDGFLIFETLNTRGADLRLSDLVKNLLIRGGASESHDRKAIADRWDGIRELVQDGRTAADVFDRFIWQSWNSRRDAVKEPELFKEIRGFVGSEPVRHLAYLEELEIDAEIYALLDLENVQVESGNTTSSAFAVPEFVDSARALAIFNVTVANSAILAIVRKYQLTDHMKQRSLIQAIRLIENFHFQFSALTNSGSTGGTRGRYNRFAVRLETATSSKEVTAAIGDLRDKLIASLPKRDRSFKAFQELFYAPNLRLTQAQKARARKAFIAYVLVTFAKYHKSLPAGQNLATWSIEHLRPQRDGSDDCHDAIYSIGNLTLLTSALNSELGDAAFLDKADMLRSCCPFLDPKLETWMTERVAVPSSDEIQQRAKQLAYEALDKVWSL